LGGSAVTLMLLTLSSVALASPGPQGVKTVTAPYHGAVNPYDIRVVYGCAQSKVTVLSFFSLAQGVGGFSALASARTCKASGTPYAYTQLGSETRVNIPFHSGYPTVYANVSFALAGNVSLVPGICHRLANSTTAWCEGSSEVTLGLLAYVLDQSTGSTIYPTSAGPLYSAGVWNTTACRSVGCTATQSGKTGPVSFRSSFSWVFFFGSKMIKGDQYVLRLVTDGEVATQCYANASAYLGCSARATMNFTTHGNGIVLKSVTET